jgi:hypothetical protein
VGPTASYSAVLVLPHRTQAHPSGGRRGGGEEAYKPRIRMISFGYIHAHPCRMSVGTRDALPGPVTMLEV